MLGFVCQACRQSPLVQICEKKRGLSPPKLAQFKRSDSKASALSYITGPSGTTERQRSWQMANGRRQFNTVFYTTIVGATEVGFRREHKRPSKILFEDSGVNKIHSIFDETGFKLKATNQQGFSGNIPV